MSSSSKDDLQSSSSVDLRSVKSDSHTHSISSSFAKSDSQTHTFSDFPVSAADDDYEDEELGEITSQKSLLLKESSSSSQASGASFWTFEYYQQFFNVETSQVVQRVAGSMVPRPDRNFLYDYIRPNPDLYGPFWICTTLVFSVAIAGNLANYLASGGQNFQWRYDFHKVTLAATAIFSYWWAMPALLYGFFWWRRSQAGHTFLEILCVYGYSLTIFIPISVLWVIDVIWLKWLLLIISVGLSGGVLVLTFWPAAKEESKRVGAIVTAVIVVLHLALATGFMLYFFQMPPCDPVAINPVTTKIPVQILKQEVVAPTKHNIPGKTLDKNIPDEAQEKMKILDKTHSKNIPGKTLDVPGDVKPTKKAFVKTGEDKPISGDAKKPGTTEHNTDTATEDTKSGTKANSPNEDTSSDTPSKIVKKKETDAQVVKKDTAPDTTNKVVKK